MVTVCGVFIDDNSLLTASECHAHYTLYGGGGHVRSPPPNLRPTKTPISLVGNAGRSLFAQELLIRSSKGCALWLMIVVKANIE